VRILQMPGKNIGDQFSHVTSAIAMS